MLLFSLLFLRDITNNMAKFYTLTIQDLIQETADAVSIVFTIPAEEQASFAFQAGQYVTLKATIDGAEVRRAYSICSSPASGTLKVAVKAVPNGVFSTYATTKLKAGDLLEVSAPEGKFVLQPAGGKRYLGIAAGSGITPVLSMVKATLEDSEASFTLIYGNKTVEDTIFYQEINELQVKYANRFTVDYVYSRARVEGSLNGRVDQGHINYLLKKYGEAANFDAAFLCGPEEMIKIASSTLETSGIPAGNIHYELFTASTSNDTEGVKDGESQVKILLDDEEASFTMKQTDTILAASLRNKLDAPYSCQGGVCSSCIAKVTEGKAVMTKNSILTDEELEEGLILTCVSHPTTPTITVDFDEV